MRILMKVSPLAIMLLVLTGCANNSKVVTSPSITVTPASLTCQSTQLMVELGSGGVAMGTVGITGMGLKNISTSTCTLSGYPILQMLNASGQSIPTYVTHGNAFGVSSSAAKVVTLSPGLGAKFDLLYHNQTGYENASCPTSTQVEITPPGSTNGIILNWKIQPYGGSTIQKLRCGEMTVSQLYTP